MRKSLTKYILVIVFFLAGVLGFSGVFSQISQVSAEIRDKEFVNFVLTGAQGYFPYSYFDDLTQATYSDEDINYLDRDGELVNTYRAIIDKINAVTNKNSTGDVEVFISGDMKKLAESGHYYAYASAGLLALENEENSKIVISISANGESVSVTSGLVYSGGDFNPDWVTTDKIFLTSDEQSVTFSFLNQKGSSIFNKADFMIFEPMISFGVEIDNITNLISGGKVSSGQLLELKAQTFLSQIEGNSDLLNYYKNYHRIEWEIVQGSNLANVSGNYLNITGTSGTIKIRAKCKANTTGDEYIYSDEITYQIDNTKNSLNLISNFSDGAVLLGGGNYTVDLDDPEISVFSKPNAGYTFLKYVDEKGVTIDSTKTASGYYKAIIDITKSRTIKVVLVKNINISEIVIEDKYYDKTTDIIKDKVIIKIDGISEEHNVSIDISGLSGRYAGALPGEDIEVFLTGSVSLMGEDSYMYNFNSTLPDYTFGNIIKRTIVIRADSNQKEYGDIDSKITYTFEGELALGDSLNGELIREAGESIGTYEILQGTLTEENNPNYIIVLDLENFGDFTITKRQINITGITVIGKTYDATTSVRSEDLSVTYTGSFLNSQTRLTYNASYENKDAGYNLPINFSATIEGENLEYYELIISAIEVRADILPKEIKITPNVFSKTYGEEDPDVFTYSCLDSLLEGDSLSGNLSRAEGEDAGLYKINIGTLEISANYEIVLDDVSFEIKKRELIITAISQSKIYGDSDPVIDYEIFDVLLDANISELSEGNQIFGALSKSGNVAGVYDITLGNLSVGDNYTIKTFNSATFTIKKRDLTVNVMTEEKDYDGNDLGIINISFTNEIITDRLALDIVAKFDNKNVSLVEFDKAITYYLNEQEIENFNEELMSGQNISSYNITFNVNYFSTINKKNVNITIPESITIQFGDEIDLSYVAEGVVDGETLVGELQVAGTNVGTYNIMQGTLTEENNPNYIITFICDSLLTITKREIKIVVDSKTIVYGEIEGSIVYYLSEETSLQAGVSLTDILIGDPQRIEGKDAGIYQYLIGSLALKQSVKNNYNLVFEAGELTINKRAVNISLHSSTKTYGEDDPLYTYTINSGSLADITDIEFIREQGEDVGEYEISISLNSNYKGVTNTAILTITPIKISIKANNLIKTYGEVNPKLTWVITKGILMFNDTFANTLTGEIEREQGENVGQYRVKIGTLEISPNYEMTFEEGMFEIQKKNISVLANNVSKFLDEETFPELTYIVYGLVGTDVLSGELEVNITNGLGEYDILQGSLSSENYNITFVSAKFSIVKRSLNIVIDYVSKQYDGNGDIDLTYTLSGDIVEGDELGVVLTKENGTDVGKYLITATCSNDKYNVIVTQNYFEILPREIVITINDIEINYGEEIPDSSTWAYEIEGIIIGNDITISFERILNYYAGDFEITCKTENNDNYNVTIISGTLTINKKIIYIDVSDYSKIYGQSDPVFGYTITAESSLYNGDVLRGNITREEGENAGIYNLICEVYNDNYTVVMNEAKFTINPKQLVLVTAALDKIYDGTDIAYLRVPVLSGILDSDDVYLDFDPTGIARFDSKEVGDHKSVEVFGGELAGEMAGNYYITRPTGLTATIAISEIEDGDIVLAALKTNTNLKYGTTLTSEEVELETTDFGKDKNVISAYSISLKYNDEDFEYGYVKVSINIGQAKYYNLQLFQVNEDGSRELVESKYEDGKLSFETDSLGTYIIIADNDEWLNYALIGVSGAFGLFVIIYVFVKLKRKIAKK